MAHRCIELRLFRRLHQKKRRVNHLHIRAQLIHVLEPRLDVEQLARLHGCARVFVAADEANLALTVDHPVTRRWHLRIRIGWISRRRFELQIRTLHVFPRIISLIDVRIGIDNVHFPYPPLGQLTHAALNFHGSRGVNASSHSVAWPQARSVIRSIRQSDQQHRYSPCNGFPESSDSVAVGVTYSRSVDTSISTDRFALIACLRAGKNSSSRLTFKPNAPYAEPSPAKSGFIKSLPEGRPGYCASWCIRIELYPSLL